MKNHQLFQATSDGNELKFHNETGIKIWLEILKDKEFLVDIIRKEQKRTNQQNKALHKFFELVSDEMNEQGIGITAILQSFKQGVDIYPTPEFIKEVWRLFQKAQLKKTSTTQLNKHEDIEKVYELFTKWLGEKFGIYIEFPSEDPHPAYQ